MRKDGIAWLAIQSFITSMDCTQPLEIHVANAIRDSWMYGWNAATTMALFYAIHETYDIKQQVVDL